MKAVGSAERPAQAASPAGGWGGAGAGHLETDVAHSVRNAVKLGASLLGTWAIAVIVRIVLPRHLGPETFGAFQFADAFTGMVFVGMTLGLETYTRIEAATRPDHADAYFGGTLVVRLVISTLLLAATMIGLRAAGRDDTVLLLILLLGPAQALANVNLTYAALLQSAGAVGGLSVLNVATKLVWGLGIVGAFALGGGVRSVAATMLAAEIMRTACLAVLARRHTGLRYRIDYAATRAVLLASMPFYVGQLATTIYSKIDVSLMSFLTSDIEVGWYGVAANLAGLSMMLVPLIGWILLPLSSRAAARSEAEMTRVFRRAMEVVLALAFPLAMFFAVGADVIVATAFGPAFAPGAVSLRLLSPTFVLTYVTIIDASILVRLERGWAVTWISISGMAFSTILNLWMIPAGLAAFGPGGAGRGAALAQVITEAYAVAVMSWLLGRRVFDRRSIVMLVKTCVVCVVVGAVHMLLAPLGAWRILVDALLYFALVIVSGALDLRMWVSVVRNALGRRRAPAGAA